MINKGDPVVQGRTMDIHFSADFGLIEFDRTAVIVVHSKHDKLISETVERKKISRK